MHLPNWVFGAGPAASIQVVLAFMSGSALYLARRTTGSLVPAMLVHGLWDFASFVGTGGGVLSAAVVWGNALLAIVLVVVALRYTRGRRVDQFGTRYEPRTASA